MTNLVNGANAAAVASPADVANAGNVADAAGLSNPANVSVRDLKIQLGANTVIENLDLDVRAGEFVVLLGPSGCGKSTLLHSIAGLIDVTDGSIEIAGVDMTWADPKDRRIALVFQSYALYPTMSVERNLSFALRINGTPKAEIARRVTRASEMLQLGPLLKRKPAQLSGGQRQRVAIGRAIVREADVFLFDEPLSNLDAKLRTELRRELKQLHQRLGATMIYVTHDQVEAMTLATRMAVMRGGVIQQFGTPAEVYARPNNLFVATFLGSPAMNLLKGTLEVRDGSHHFCTAHLRLDVTQYPFKDLPTDRLPCVLGVRAEDVRVGEGSSTEMNERANISLIEPMGNHRVIWLDYHGVQIASIDQTKTPVAVGDTAAFAFDSAHISLFDEEGGARL
ncbi:sn-glycerol-3-phosphate import ATP-binding protein UgpC [Paraburkholderia domus]|uniref:ABC transporter ATP-binding protein n=1 Tax=Paraburkholderia domus TaxID=2793075 RepID=UPI0019116A47|nr:ABC transporter ATP-binding protein [Paraburkholderia domus]MBK5052718.1 ABC transporter ATP-binding protein [Burkholderia sp. R-70006]MBK5063574.1 ABC transporter ATP-binding protein [Burkholderia sp. R-70199]MBK5088435.1 ABC transporter ATP-binding protein [Burkholderia sp. R-69927]MBK5123751.1 ABC transporter ATP-binding protein [Burkholderia sp. R-69980]MBK5183674.1 ABC transporter ATP-binding protein [Burkholderia sp. R-69749]MCI0151331.1 ATP-binding cassette domain-containing protein